MLHNAHRRGKDAGVRQPARRTPKRGLPPTERMHLRHQAQRNLDCVLSSCEAVVALGTGIEHGASAHDGSEVVRQLVQLPELLSVGVVA